MGKHWYLPLTAVVLILLTVVIFFFGDLTLGGTKTGTSIVSKSAFIDDAGNFIELDGPYKRIVSLFAEHTENLFFLGAGDLVIGADRASVFPPPVVGLPRYSLTKDYDIDQIIAAKPDLVLVSPDINRKYPGPVTRLETAGLKVVSLRPGQLKDFDIYIEKLAMLTGKKDVYRKLLAGFYDELEEISAIAAVAEKKTTIFFESSELGYLTPAEGTLPFLAMEYAGGENIAGSPRSMEATDIHAPFGLENILGKADEIDVYVTLQGRENPGAPAVSVGQKPGFGRIKAVREGRLYEIENVFINSYTFRYPTGVREIARFLYPELYDDLSLLKNDETLDRRSFSEIVVKYLHLPLYVNASASHYDYKRYNHTYGSFPDVSWKDEEFDYIETAVMRSYLSGYSGDDGGSYFRPEEPVTRSDIAEFIYILYDLEAVEEHEEIRDIGDDGRGAAIRKVADHKLMETENGYFHPEGTVTNREFIEFLERLPK